MTRRLTSLMSGISLSAFIMAIAFTATANAAQVTLAWDQTSGSVAGYRLFARSGGMPYDYAQPAWQGANTSCTIAQLDENATHYFVVRAFDSQGVESANSNEVVFRAAAQGDPGSIPTETADPTPPARPVAVTPGANAQDVGLEPDLMTSAFSDSDAGDYHTHTRWQVFRTSDDVCVFDLYSDIFLIQLNIPPLVLDANSTYYWTAQHYNQADGASAPAVNTTFTTTDRAADDNGNGVPDSQEIVADTDLDRDGQPDAGQSDLKCFATIFGDQQIGIQVPAGQTAAARLQAAQSVDASAITNPGRTQPDLPVGLYNFKIAVDQPGEPVAVKIHFARPVSAQDHFYMFDPATGYVDFGAGSMIAPDGLTATLELQDGGEGDMDGVANGTIVSLGAYGSSITDSSSAGLSGTDGGGDGGGGGGCFIGSLLNP